MNILGTQSQKYLEWRSSQGSSGRNNGAYWYAKEIEDIILPEMSDLNVVVNTVMAGMIPRWSYPPRPIIVCHDNVNTVNTYMKLFGLNALWICSKESVAELLASKGEKSVYIPLSVDTAYVAQYKRNKKTKNKAYVGNAWSFKKAYLSSLPDDVDQLYNMERDELLKEMSKYKHIIAEGRCLIEAKILGAKTTLPNYEGINVIERDIVDTHDVIPLWREAIESHQRSYSNEVIIECMKSFNDMKAGKQRRVGELFMVSHERAEELLSNEHNIVEKI